MIFSIKKYLNFNAAPTIDVHVLDFGKKLSAANCRYHKPDHSVFFMESPTFTYVVSGNKYMFINNKEFFLKEGDLLFIPKNSVVFTYIPQQAIGFESINVIVQDALLKDGAMPFANTNDPVLFSSALIKSIDRVLENDFEGFKISLNNEALNSTEKKDACITFLSQLTRSLILNKAVDKGSKMRDLNETEKIKTVLLEKMYTSVSLSHIATHCHMSVSSFKRKFELLFGVPPKTWKRTVCLQTAYFVLKTGNYKISDLPDAVGFENFSHFSYAFKKQFKLSPSAITGTKPLSTKSR